MLNEVANYLNNASRENSYLLTIVYMILLNLAFAPCPLPHTHFNFFLAL